MEFNIISKDTYTVGQETELLTGTNGVTQIIRDLFFNNSSTTDTIKVKLYYNGKEFLNLEISPESTEEVTSLICAKSSSDSYTFKADNAGLVIHGTIVEP